MKKYSPIVIRTRFATDIVAEVCFPERQTGKVAVLAIGAPTSNAKRETLLFLAAQGYVVIFPRYRGTWESSGWFLEKSPAQDIRDVVIELEKKKSVTDIATGTKMAVKVSAVHLFGGSFGGPAVLLNTDLPIVKKVIATCPVIDWRALGEDEPFDFFVRFSREGFGGMYRTKTNTDWNKLLKPDFYNPATQTSLVHGHKVLIIHAKDDRNVLYGPVVPFAEKTGASYYLKPTGGHDLRLYQLFLWRKMATFLKKK